MATAEASPRNTATPSPTALEAAESDEADASQPVLAVDGFAEVVTTDLVVRSAPGTGQDSDTSGTVANLAVYVLDGPVQADGYEWWLIVPLDYFDRFEPPPSGWVAAGSQDEVWLAPTPSSCDDAPSSETLWAIRSVVQVGCYGGVELTLRGTLSGCAAAAGAAWDHGCSLRNCLPEVCQTLFDDRAVTLHFDALPARDVGRIRVTGHFDDPAAERCSVDGDALSRLNVFRCRTHFVVTSYQFAD
jgi:hypothetical protein